MLFTSYEFIGFVALLLLLYYIVPKKFQWQLLLLASYIFYWIANPIYLIYILTTTVSIYLVTCRIQKNADRTNEYLKLNKDTFSKDEKKEYKKQQKKIRLRWAVFCGVFNLGILACVKYLNFFIENINSIVKVSGGQQLSFVKLIVPMGISFYTFQAVGYLIDVYRGSIKAEKNIGKVALFVSFFPQLVQGPIGRFGDLSQTMFEEHSFDARKVSYGLQRVLWGFFKKLVVADRIFAAVSTLIKDVDTYHGAYAVVAMLFYTIQLYADFTGGIDVVIGIGEMLGITMQENFNRPYFAKSLKEYWRRWHISMCNWFRDYVFYPVSTSGTLQKFAKFSRKKLGDKIGKRLPVYISTFVVWFCTGIWHGANWNFIVWGLLNWLVLMVSEELEPLYQRFHNRFHVEGKFAYKLFAVGRTFILVCVLNIFDCYTSVADTLSLIGSVFVARNWAVLWDGSLLKIGLSASDYIVLAVGIFLMLFVSLVQRSGKVRDKIAAKPYVVKVAIWLGLFIAVLVFGAYGIGYDSSQFIYNQF